MRVYDLPLILQSETMVENIGKIMGYFKEMDSKEAYCNGIFLRIKVYMDMKQPINRGTMV